MTDIKPLLSIVEAATGADREACVDEPLVANIRVWARRGKMLVNTSALPIDDPDHPYRQLLAQGLRPEDYGVKHPHAAEFKDRSRSDLIEEIIDLRQQNLALERHLA